MSGAADNLVAFRPGGGGAGASGPPVPPPGDDGGGGAADLALAKLPLNDLGLAERLMRRFGEDLALTAEMGWAAWDGRRFDFDRGPQVARQRCHEVAKLMREKEYAAAKKAGMAAFPWISDPDDYVKMLAAFYKFSIGAGNLTRTRGMLEQAAVYLGRPLSDFDARHDLLNCANGTLALEYGGALRPPSRDDLISRIAAAKYDPAAKCPAFEAHMKKVQPEPELRQFVQRCLGYCLLGGNREQVFFLFQGRGGDGKSTTLNAVRAALGEYAATSGIETFLHNEHRSGSGASPDVARLAAGVRLVLASEPEQGARLSGSILKSVTGGEPIAARRLQREFFEFSPGWSLIISCNRKPRIVGDDDGFWRRTVVVPWPVQIARAERDKSIDAKLAAEKDGILNWLLAGLMDYLERDGLESPESAQAALDDYRRASNPFAEWYEECCVPERGARVLRKTLYESYKNWCDDNSIPPMSARALYSTLADRQHPVVKSVGEHFFTGIRERRIDERFEGGS